MARIERYAEGQLVVAQGITVVGSLYMQRINSATSLNSASFRTAISLHSDHGLIWQLVSVQVSHGTLWVVAAAGQLTFTCRAQVDSSCGEQGLGDLMINHALSIVSKMQDVDEVVAVTRCRSWAEARQQ